MNRPADTAPLPDPFRFFGGGRVATPADWPRRRAELRDAITRLEFGGLPPTPASTQLEVLHTQTVESLSKARFISCRVQTGPERPFSFLLTLLVPPGEGPFPVVLAGDGCWRYVTEEITAEVLGRGFALAQFNRTELAADVPQAGRTGGLYRVYPEGTFGALAAWAWGYHRCVDALQHHPLVDAARIAVAGHSRGGKATLLAGATDERIAFTWANNSGAGGAGCYRWQGPNSERLADLLRNFPYWFGPELPAYVGREAELPFDHHELKALVAPRALLTTEALSDPWANPSGTWQSHRAAAEVFRFLNAEDKLAIHYREGPHHFGRDDWRVFLATAAWQFGLGPKPAGLNASPFADLPPAYEWSAPGA